MTEKFSAFSNWKAINRAYLGSCIRKWGEYLGLTGFSAMWKWEVGLKGKVVFFERFLWIYCASALQRVMRTLGSIAALFTTTLSIILWNIWTWLSILIGTMTLTQKCIFYGQTCSSEPSVKVSGKDIWGNTLELSSNPGKDWMSSKFLNL